MTSPTSVRGRRPILLALFVVAALVVAALALRLAEPPRPFSIGPTPSPNPTPTVLHLAGAGNVTSPAFSTGSDWAALYSFNCPTSTAFLIVEVGGVLNGVSIAESTTSTGSATGYVHNAPGVHRLRIESGCSWTLTVVDGDTLPRETPAGVA